MKVVQQHYGYENIILLDINRDVVLATNDSLSEVTLVAKQMLNDKLPGKADFKLYKSELSGKIILDFYGAVLDNMDELQGYLILRSDPDKYLYPTISRWPTATKTAEALLVERSGDSVHSLNDPKYRPGASLKSLIALNQTNNPGVNAVLGGSQLFDGMDYRKVQVMSYWVPVLGTDWKIIAKVDREELFEPIRYQARAFAVILTMLFLLLASLWLLIRNTFQKSLYKSLFFDSPDGYLILRDGVFVECNRASEVLIGGDRSSIIGKSPVMISPDYQPNGKRSEEYILDVLEEANNKGGASIEWVHTRVDGSAFLAQINLSSIEYEGYTSLLVTWRDITQVREAENQLRKLSRAVEQSPVSVVITNLEGNIEYANPMACLTTGYSMEELLGNNPRVLKSGETHVDEYQKLWNNITMGSQWRGVFHNKRKNGELYWESSTISPIVDARGKITHYLAVKEDITDKKMAEEELRKFQTISESADYGNVISDLDGNLLYSNKCFAEMQGYEVSEIIGKNLSMLHSEQQMIRVVESLELLRSKGKFQAEEIWRTRKDGTTFPSLMNAMIIKDEAGKPLFLSATVIDITEKKIKDAEISKLSQAIEQSPILVVITDLSGNIIYVNPAFEVTTGYTRQEIMGKNPRILNSGKLDKSFFKDLWDTIVQGKEWKGELINRKKNGELYWENMSVTPIQDSSGRITNYLAIKQDITGSKENEQKIQELNASLELKVEERTAQLTQTNEELAKEIEDRKLKEAFELELLQLSLQLTGIAASESQHAISLSLERIGRFTGADRTFVFEIDPEGETFSASFEWSSVPDQLSVKTQKSIPMNLLPKWWEHLRQGKPITIPDLDALPESWASEKSILKPYGDKSILVVPMFSEEKLIGYCGMATVRERKEFGKEEVNLLTIWSGMLTSVLNNIHAGFLLDQTRKNYETFFNTLDDFLWILDNEGTIIHFNNTALVRLGFTLEELGGKSILMVHPDERRQEAEVLLGRLLSGSSEVFSIPLRAKSGLVIPVETKAIDGYWNGKPVIFMASKDISQIKLSEEKFSTAFQSNSAMMAIPDFNNGNFVDVNHAFLELFGYTREEVIGKTSKQLNLFADNSLRDEILMKLSHNIPVRKIELPMVTKTGEIKTGLLSADTVIVGTTRCMLTVTLDITDRKKMEEQLKAAHEEANRANVAKSEFLSRMSHELRTPMNSILGFAQLIEMGELNPRQAKGIKHILNSGKHLLDLINEVLEISRIEAGKLSLSLEPIQIQGIIQEMMEIVWPLAKDRQLTLDLISSNLDQLYVLADRQRLKQVLLNLISNAVKYNIPGGSIWISATLMTENVHGSVPVRISITDTGLGIARESISRLFNPFERVGAENSATEGTGLGLAVVKKLVEAMGGSVGVESVVGEGSTFWIDLPQTESQLKQFNKSENYTDFVHSLSNLAGTILYIEDNTSNIELVEQILFSHCNLIKLISNRNGRDALRLALEHRPDLILLDLNLPDMHGSEVLDLLRSNPDARQIPVVVISADATAQQLEKLKKKGAEDYLTKPLDVREFLKMINRTVGSN